MSLLYHFFFYFSMQNNYKKSTFSYFIHPKNKKRRNQPQTLDFICFSCYSKPIRQRLILIIFQN